MKKSEVILTLILIYGLVLIIYYRGLFNFFFQDDFINIYLGWFKSPNDLLSLFSIFLYYPYNAFRPIAYYLFGFIVIYLFKLNPIISHASLFIIHFVNIFLIYKVFRHLIPDKKIRLLVSFLYAVSSIHFGILYWWTANYLSLGTMFLLIGFEFLTRYEIYPTRLNYVLFILFDILVLLTNEGLFLLPLLLLVHRLVLKTKNISKALIPSIIISGISLAFRSHISKFASLPDYAIGSLGEIAGAFKWYFYRAINLPEGIRTMDTISFRIIILILLVLFIIFITLVYFLYKSPKKLDKHLLVFGISWYLIFGFPFFLLVHHLSAFYLNTALIGLIIAFVSVWEPFFQKNNLLNKTFIFPFLSGYFLISWINVSYLHKTHWIVWRAEIARKYLQKTIALYPNIPRGSTIILSNTSISLSEIEIALYGDKALRLYYNDPSLHVAFGDKKCMTQRQYIVSD